MRLPRSRARRYFPQLDSSTNFQRRDYALSGAVAGGADPDSGVEHGGGPPATRLRWVRSVLGAGVGAFQCAHSHGQSFNNRIGTFSHLGISSTYSNPGTLMIRPWGCGTFPLKGHEITGWYVNRQVVPSALMDRGLYCRGSTRGSTGNIRKSLLNELGGFWHVDPQSLL